MCFKAYALSGIMYTAECSRILTKVRLGIRLALNERCRLLLEERDGDRGFLLYQHTFGTHDSVN
jgi:hypothetical protein